MEVRPVRNDADHTIALGEIDRLWGTADGTLEGDKLEVLTTLVEAYENRRWPAPDGTPLVVLHFALSDMGRSQKDLAEVLGSRSQASDVLSGRRRVSLAVAQKISVAWNSPIQLLVTPYEVRVA